MARASTPHARRSAARHEYVSLLRLGRGGDRGEAGIILPERPPDDVDAPGTGEVTPPVWVSQRPDLDAGSRARRVDEFAVTDVDPDMREPRALGVEE